MRYAYDELYLLCAQRMLGDMYDFAVNTLEIELENFQKMFLVSDVSKQIAAGNCMYLAGKNGCEVAREVVEECTGVCPEQDDIMYLDKSPEYWIGWSLAYYQWEKAISFADIEAFQPARDMYGMYKTLHEADVSVFVSVMDEKRMNIGAANQLKRLRTYAGLSQSALSRASGVPIRQIQLFEQGQRDIRKCQGQTLMDLAETLRCRIEDLIR